MGCFALLWAGHSYFGVVHLRCMHNCQLVMKKNVRTSFCWASIAGVLLVCCNVIVIVIILNQLMNIGVNQVVLKIMQICIQGL